MLSNYLKIAWRTLLKSRIFSLINIFGLALGMTAFILIFQYVHFEVSYDQFQPEGDRIFRVVGDTYYNGEPESANAYTVPALGQAVKSAVPGVEDYFRLTRWADSYTIVLEQAGETITFREERAIFADPGFPHYFSLKMTNRQSGPLLAGPNGVIISASTARKYFGEDWKNKQITGESIRVFNSNRDPDISFLIEGIYEDMPANSHLQYDLIFSHKSLPDFLPKEIPEADRLSMFENSWNPKAWYTYLVLDPGAGPERIAAQLTEIGKERTAGSGSYEEYQLQPIEDIHLESDLMNEPGVNGNKELVYVMMLIGVLILAIAWINYVNLATARAMTRETEFRLRKVIGAGRKQLVWQFMLETFILNLLALLLAVTLTQLTVPMIRDLTGIPLDYLSAANGLVWLIIGLALVCGTLLTGLYPAWILSGYRPLVTSSGTSSKQFRGAGLRRVLVVFQFVASLSLIVGTLVIYRQMEYMQHQDLGYEAGRLLVVEGPNALDPGSSFGATVEQFRNLLGSFPEVGAVTATSMVPGSGDGLYREMFRVGVDEQQTLALKEVLTDGNYLEVLGVEVLAGRLFSDLSDQNRNKVVLNEAAIRALGFEAPQEAIGARIGMHGYGGMTDYEITGVIRNFHQSSLQHDFEPMGFFTEMYSGSYVVQLASSPRGAGDLSGVIDRIRSGWTELFPNDAFSYYFLDQYFDRQYQSDRQFGRLFLLFSVLAVVIGCLGLFALTAFSVGRRTKEIGIRKLLGASVWQVVVLLSRDILALVLIASLISIPLMYYLSQEWLENYAFRTGIAWWLLAAPVLLVLLLAAATVSVHTFRIAQTAPAETLRRE